MLFITWDKSYNTDIRTIDRQHKKIIAIINDAYSSYEETLTRSQFESLLKHLRDYIKVHFTAEETFLAKIAYPGLAAQRREHHHFIDQLCEIEKRFVKTGEYNTARLFNFVWDWFSQHILIEDKKFAAFLKSGKFN